MKSQNLLILLLTIFMTFGVSKAQVSINSSGAAPDASAMLDVASTDAGILIPRMTELQRNSISSPATGLMIFQTNGDAPGFYFYNGTDWQNLYSGDVPSVPGDTEYWLRPDSDPTYIYPEGNEYIRIYDQGETYGIWYEGSTNQYGIWSQTGNSTDPTAAVVGFSNVSGNQTYGYLGYNGTYSSGTGFGSVDGMAVYGVVDDPSRAAGFFRTTSNASMASLISYSDVWIGGYFYTDNADNTYAARPALYAQAMVDCDQSGYQNAIKGYSEFTHTTNNGYTVGGSFIGKGGTQDAIGAYSYVESDEIAYSLYATTGSADDVGVFGIGNNETGNYVSGSGGSFTGNTVGVYGRANNAGAYAGWFHNNGSPASYTDEWAVYGYHQNSGSNDGTGYGNLETSGALKGYTYWGPEYSFAVAGYNYNDDNRCGGVIGSKQDGSYWGSLGYEASSGNTYGGYFNNNHINGSGKNTNNIGIGSGNYGTLMGSWIKGDIYGANIKGERYSLYIDGKQYTNDVITQLNDNGTQKRTPTYVPTSMSVDIYMKGTGKLKNGKATIKFDDKYTNLISKKEPVFVTVTPMGQTNGVYLETVKSEGFTVVENNNGKSNTNFTWIAIATRKGYENPENPKELLSNEYDKNMNKVMFNENNLDNNATPIWWDGNKIRFDDIPQENIIKKEPKELDILKQEDKKIRSSKINEPIPNNKNNIQ